MFVTELHAKQAVKYLTDAESLSAYHSPQNYRKTGHHLSKNGLHHPVPGMVGEESVGVGEKQGGQMHPQQGKGDERREKEEEAEWEKIC